MAPQLSSEEVKKIANLARLELDSAEVNAFQKKLAGVLEHVAELESLDLKGEGFPQHVPADSVAFREDKAAEGFPREKIIANAPKFEADHFILPAVMEDSP